VERLDNNCENLKYFYDQILFLSSFSLASGCESSDCDLYSAGDVCHILRHPLPNVQKEEVQQAKDWLQLAQFSKNIRNINQDLLMLTQTN
jgi:hypothetical protein